MQKIQTLLLTSQGIQPELKNIFLSLLHKHPKDISVAFITTGAYGEKVNPDWLQKYITQLNDLDIYRILELDFTGKTYKEVISLLNGKDIIFVNGGNTFYLLKHARESGFDRAVKKQLAKGVLYIGVSAGTYIVCPTIEQAHWKNANRNYEHLNDLTAFNLVPFLIFAHFNETHRVIIEKESKQTQFPIVAIGDTQAVLVEGDRYKVVGKGNKEFFNGFRENW